MFGGFKASKFKATLKMAAQRIKLVNNKMENKIKRDKKEIANLLSIGKEEKARIKVEHVIRDDYTMEAHELIELLCETVVARLPLIASMKECPFDMVSAVSTLIYAANRCQIKELQDVKKQLTRKYKKDFAERAEKNIDQIVNERIIQKLSIQPPNSFLVLNYLKEIAKQYKVTNWKPQEPNVDLMAPMPTATGYSVKPSPGAKFGNLYDNAQRGGMPRQPNQKINVEPLPQQLQMPLNIPPHQGQQYPNQTIETNNNPGISENEVPMSDAEMKRQMEIYEEQQRKLQEQIMQIEKMNQAMDTSQHTHQSTDPTIPTDDVPPVNHPPNDTLDEFGLPSIPTAPPSNPSVPTVPYVKPNSPDPTSSIPPPPKDDFSHIPPPPQNQAPDNNSSTNSPDIPDFDELTRRFNELRK